MVEIEILVVGVVLVVLVDVVLLE
ncbi:hypothetical protein A2U01_0109016, partial [Trifolium medium]|nr:hypothetical protein [Trifolium medium]